MPVTEEQLSQDDITRMIIKGILGRKRGFVPQGPPLPPGMGPQGFEPAGPPRPPGMGPEGFEPQGPPLPPDLQTAPAASPDIVRDVLARRSVDEQGGYSGGRLRFPAQELPPAVRSERTFGPPADLSGATLPPSSDAASSNVPGDQDFVGPQLPPGGHPLDRKQEKGESEDERRLRLLQAARTFREGASQFRNITGESEMWLRGGNVPDRSIRDEDTRAEEERVRGRIEEARTGDPHNPNSPISESARALYREMSKQEPPADMTAAQVMALHPMLKEVLEGRVAGENKSLEQTLALLREMRSQRADERAARGEQRDIEKFEYQKEKDARPTPAQAAQVAQQNQTLAELRNLLDKKPEFNTGPITDAFENMMTFVGAAEFKGMDKSEKLAFKSDIASMLAAYMKSISGTAIAEAEARRLAKAFPTPQDDDQTFMKKGKAAIQRILVAREQFLNALEASGKDVSKLRAMSLGDLGNQPSEPSEPSAGASGGGARYIKGSDGRKYPFDPDLPVGAKFRDPQGNVLTVTEVGGGG